MLTPKVDHTILRATVDALHQIRETRFYSTERGYQGRFYCALQKELMDRGFVDGNCILEQGYHRSAMGGEYQRPDIVLHVPAEDSGAPAGANNFGVWALKRAANTTSAQDDFNKLDGMFHTLNYPLGVFINLDSDQHHFSAYTGPFTERLFCAAVQLVRGGVAIHRSANWPTAG